MKAGSDNFRESSILGVIERLEAAGVRVVVYEPNLESGSFNGFELIPDFATFAGVSDLIIANRNAPELESSRDKIYTRDLFGDN